MDDVDARGTEEEAAAATCSAAVRARPLSRFILSCMTRRILPAHASSQQSAATCAGEGKILKKVVVAGSRRCDHVGLGFARRL